MDLAELLTRESIRDLIARYNSLGDRGDSTAVAALFAQNGTLELIDHGASRVATGPRHIAQLLDDVAADWRAAATTAERVYHAVSTHVIDISTPTTARGTAYVSVIRGAGLAEWGRYIDTYVQADGVWRFDVRRAFRDGVTNR